MGDRLKDIESKRAALHAKRDDAEQEQLAKDLEAIYEFELTQRVGMVKMPFVSGTPVRAAVRAAKPAELKRYRARIKINREGKIDHGAAHDAAVELGFVCQLYPEPKSEIDTEMREAHPNVEAALGLLALQLAGAEEVAEGKD